MEGQHALDDDAGRGICFVGIHLANIYARALSIWKKCFLGSTLITIVELFTGIIVNLWMHWHVWDYSSQWMNFLGQVCPLFSFFWFVLTFPLLFLSNQINRFFPISFFGIKASLKIKAVENPRPLFLILNF